MKRLTMPLVPPGLALATGIAVSPWIPERTGWLVLAATLALAGLGLLVGTGSHAVVPLLGAVIALGTLHGTPRSLAPDHVARLQLPLAARVEGRLAREPHRWAPESTRLLLHADRVGGRPRSGLVSVTVYGAALPLVAGQRVAIEARLDRPRGFRNPGVPDAAVRLAREGVLVSGNAAADRVWPLEPPAPPWPARVRRWAANTLAARLPPASAALLGGLLLGARDDLPPEIREAFRDAGVYHVLAVSGFNVALLAGAVWAVARAAGFPRGTAAGGAAVAVVGFATVVGPEPSVLRAALMAILVLGAVMLDREASVANSLGLAWLSILAVRPADLWDPGFQLSFAATAGIVAAPIPRGPVAGAVIVSLAAQAAVLPITLFHFNQLSLIGPVANLAVVPLAAFATILGLLALAASTLGDWIAGAAFGAIWPLLLALRGAVRLAAAIPGAVLHLPAPSGSAIACYATGLALAGLAWHVRVGRPTLARRACPAAGLLLTVAGVLGAWPAVRPADGRLHVSVLDVGQGDAIVVEAPAGQAVVVDAGTGGPWRADAGERVVAPFLWNRGILRLAVTALTHSDVDHAGGMGAVRRRFPVGEAWTTATTPGPRLLGGMAITLLSAPTPSPRDNDRALVLRVELGAASILLASDIEAAAEAALVAAGVPVEAAVLKVPHHGAATSSTLAFLKAVHPSVAIVSVGARNAHGHPDAAALGRLAAAGSRVYRTDRDGAVLLSTDGRTLTITTWADRRTERLCLDPETIC